MLIHNVASKRRLLPLATLGLVKQLDHVLCLSERSKQELLSRYGVPATRVSVIGSRVDTHFFEPAPSVPVKAQVCSAGAVNRDYQTLIKAGTQLGVPVKIAADTAWAYSVGSHQPAQISLPPNVEMRSWGTYSNLRQLYAESAMVVVPLARSLLSGVTVALEGMAMGKPVVLTRNPYVEEFLQDGETGYFVQPGDVEGLAKKLRYLLDHPEEAARVGQRARDWVLERFTVQKYVNRILEAFN
jgi:glycosyltransferase involved in cell wall biosynthesis